MRKAFTTKVICHTCDEEQGAGYRPPMRTISVTKPRERCVIDVTYMELFEEMKYICLGVDAFTKRAWGKCLATRDAAAIRGWLLEDFVTERFEIWGSDNGGEFV